MTRLSRYLCTAAATALALPSAAQDRDLLVFDYAGFEDPAFHSNYIEAHGASPSFTFFGDEEEALQKVVSGFRADVSQVCAGSVTKWIDAGIIEPWDISKLPEFGNLDANLTGQDIAAAASDTYFVPTYWGSTAIAYNADQVPAEAVASLDVFRNPAFAGRMTIPDNVDDAWALAYLATGTTNWQEATDAQFEAAAAWLREVHENLRTYWVDPAELSQLMATGEILVSWAWNETVPTLADMGFPIGFQREPAEGSSVWLCGYVNLNVGSGVEEKAYDYLNAVLDPSSTGALLESGYGHANAAAMAAQTVVDLDDVGLGAISAPVLAQLPMSTAQREKHAAAFERIKAGF